MGLNMCGQPSCSLRKIRKARKKHKCCECYTNIEKGSQYEYISGVWDGVPDSFKTCLTCSGLRVSAIFKADEYGYQDESYPSFGGLLEWICEFESEYGQAFAKVKSDD
jgi:hypothetical protein